MDEPYSAVDPIVRARLQDELLDAAAPGPQDDRARHPRHRRGHQAGRPHRHPQRGRRARAGRSARGAAAGAGQRLRGRLPGRRPGHQAPVADAVGQTPAEPGPGGRAHGHGRRGPGGRWRPRAPTGWPCRRRAACGAGSAADVARWCGAPVADAEPRPFVAVVRADTTLKAALDGIVTSRTRVAVVVDARGGSRATADRRAVDAGTLPRHAHGRRPGRGGHAVSPGRAAGGRRAARPLGLGARPHRRHLDAVLGARAADGAGRGHRVRHLDGAGARRRALALDLRAARRRSAACCTPSPAWRCSAC